jgi:methionine-S-sulfoxide reductase
VCSGRTGHNEVVRVVFDPGKTSYEALLKVFWDNHDPTQGMRQGNDVGTQYRSGIYTYDAAQQQAAERSRALFQDVLQGAGFGAITTEIVAAPEFYYAEEYHQQYLVKNPGGYCGLGGTGVGVVPDRRVRLPLMYQLVLEFTFWEEMSLAEIAEAMDTPVGTAATRLRRAKQLLAAEMMELATSTELRSSISSGLETWARMLRDQR